MIEQGYGNLLTADVEALVNTVNTVGVMGKGIALQFKRAFPANFRAYQAACARGDVRLGHVWAFDTGVCGNGGLFWDEVHPLIEQACARLNGVRAVVFPPEGA